MTLSSPAPPSNPLHNPPRPVIAIAGASGFVGRALTADLATDFDVVALARKPFAELPERATFRACNLYHAHDASAALKGANVAFYLVHSMMPAARLVQASFPDLDLVCADNFARAANENGVERIIYLGGLTPAEDELSPHLRSREEVQRALASYGAKVITLRAGMVVGAGGSSFRILQRMVERLPTMIVPRWGSTMSQPIALVDAVALLRFALLHPEFDGGVYDIGSPSRLSYSAMLRTTATRMGKRRHLIELPFNAIRPSLMWVSAVSGAPRDLVDPLVASLQHEMVAKDGLEFQRAAQRPGQSFEMAVDEAIHATQSGATASATASGAASAGTRPKPATDAAEASKIPESLALSLQRFPAPQGLSARDVALEYFRWLPNAMRPWLTVDVLETGVCRFRVSGTQRVLLELSFAATESQQTRAVYQITGGLLRRKHSNAKGILEFRTVLNGRYLLTLVDQFSPQLPWLLYRYTQAVVHAWVMARFGRHLQRRYPA